MSDGQADWIAIIVAGATILSAGTAFISALSASASKRSASDAQKSALSAWEETARATTEANTYRQRAGADTARRLRIPYVRTLTSYINWILARRFDGLSIPEIQRLDVADQARVDAIIKDQADADEVTAQALLNWAVRTAFEAPVQKADVGSLLAASEKVSQRIDLWREDPPTAIALCDADDAGQ